MMVVLNIEIKFHLDKMYKSSEHRYIYMLKELNSKIFSTLFLFSNGFIKTKGTTNQAYKFAMIMKLQKFKELLVYNYRKLAPSNIDTYIDEAINNFMVSYDNDENNIVEGNNDTGKLKKITKRKETK